VFCRHNPLRCFSTSVYCCKRIFRYRLSPETFGYTLVLYQNYATHCSLPEVHLTYTTIRNFSLNFLLSAKHTEHTPRRRSMTPVKLLIPNTNDTCNINANTNKTLQFHELPTSLLKMIWGSGWRAPRILYICTRWRSVVTFTPRPL
jgi:hypothetical protein